MINTDIGSEKMAEKKPIIRLNLVKIKEAGYKLLNNEEEWKKFSV